MSLEHADNLWEVMCLIRVTWILEIVGQAMDEIRVSVMAARLTTNWFPWNERIMKMMMDGNDDDDDHHPHYAFILK